MPTMAARLKRSQTLNKVLLTALLGVVLILGGAGLWLGVQNRDTQKILHNQDAQRERGDLILTQLEELVPGLDAYARYQVCADELTGQFEQVIGDLLTASITNDDAKTAELAATLDKIPSRQDACGDLIAKLPKPRS